jgi:hypothetical protein
VQAANQAVARLVTLGVLREPSGKKYNRVFVAEAIFKILLS